MCVAFKLCGISNICGLNPLPSFSQHLRYLSFELIVQSLSQSANQSINQVPNRTTIPILMPITNPCLPLSHTRFLSSHKALPLSLPSFPSAQNTLPISFFAKILRWTTEAHRRGNINLIINTSLRTPHAEQKKDLEGALLCQCFPDSSTSLFLVSSNHENTARKKDAPY